jgi:polysaccharide biosynthesis protein PelF
MWLNAFSNFASIAYDCADVITTLYEGNQKFQRMDGAQPQKLRVIPNGIDYARYSAIERSQDPRPPTVALIGRIVPIKDVRTFIFACASLRRQVPDAQALILGPEDEDEAYAAECHRLVEQEGLQDCVHFLGRVDVAAYLGRVDVVALTSISEAQPLVLLEAGAAGIPSVATDVGSCREMLDGFSGDPVKGRGGFVVGVGDSQAIGDAIGSLLADGRLRAEMGDVMRRRVEAFYNKTLIDRVYNGLYETVMTQAATPAAARA